MYTRNGCHCFGSYPGLKSATRPTISSLASTPLVATSAIQPPMLIQPVIHDKNRLYRGGLMIATQWYCPPAVGYAERNSPIDMASATFPMPAVSRPQITDDGPPLGSARDMDTESACHESRMANASPSSEMKEKFRRSSGSCPSAMTWASSCTRRSMTTGVQSRPAALRFIGAAAPWPTDKNVSPAAPATTALGGGGRDKAPTWPRQTGWCSRAHRPWQPPPSGAWRSPPASQWGPPPQGPAATRGRCWSCSAGTRA